LGCSTRFSLDPPQAQITASNTTARRIRRIDARSVRERLEASSLQLTAP
jgi:hypothetical protein